MTRIPVLIACFFLSLLLTLGSGPILAQQSPQQPVSAAQWVEQGRENYDRGQFSAAIQVWQQAAREYEAQGDPLNQAMVLNYLCLAYQKQGQWLEAKTAITDSLSLLAAENAPERIPLIARSLNTRGRLEWALGQSEQALETWKRAAQAYEQAGDRAGATGSQINQAQSLEAMGLHRQTCKTLLAALQLEERCDFSGSEGEQRFNTVLRTFTEQGDERIQGVGLRSLGNLLRLTGDFDRALKVLNRALESASSPDEESATHLSLGKTAQAIYGRETELFNRSSFTQEKEVAKEKAQDAFDKAAKYYQQAIEKAPTSLRQIQAQLHRLRLLVDAQHWLETLPKKHQFADRAQLTAQIHAQIQTLRASPLAELPPSRAAIYAQLNFAQTLMEWDKSLAHLALEWATAARQNVQALEIQDPQAESYALGTLGYLYEQQQQWSEAQTLTEQAVRLAQAVQAGEIAYQWQWQLGRVLKAQGKEEQAIAAYETAVQTLESVRGDLLATQADVRFTFRDNIEPIYRDLVALLLSGTDPPQTHLQESLYYTESLQLAELENFLRCNLQEIGAVQISHSAQKAPTAALSDRINRVVRDDPTVALFYPILLGDRVAVLLKLPQEEGLRYYFHRQPRAEIETLIDELLVELKEDHTTPKGKELSAQIYDWLIRPVESDLQARGVKTLAFVLDGSLWNIPMAALYDKEAKQYLIEKNYGVILTPSLQLLDPKPLIRENLSVLGAGVSEGQIIDGTSYTPIENVKVELNRVRETTPGQILLNADFTKENLQAQLDSASFSIVHIATHGKFSSDPAQTFILAWGQRLNVAELDNLVRARNSRSGREIELLILTACETARGDKRATLGIAGVAVRAGARSTLASLWRASDELSVSLMEAFYQQLLDNPNLPKTEALRQAQLQLLARSGSKPYDWAPYILVGNWQ